MAKRKPKLRVYSISYAYDTPSYADFTIEATSEAEAARKARKALKDGCFADVVGTFYYDNAPMNERVFVNCVARVSHDNEGDEPDDHLPDMEDLEGFERPKGAV